MAKEIGEVVDRAIKYRGINGEVMEIAREFIEWLIEIGAKGETREGGGKVVNLLIVLEPKNEVGDRGREVVDR